MQYYHVISIRNLTTWLHGWQSISVNKLRTWLFLKALSSTDLYHQYKDINRQQAKTWIATWISHNAYAIIDCMLVHTVHTSNLFGCTFLIGYETCHQCLSQTAM